METIKAIDKFSDDKYDGFKITTDKQEIFCKISNGQDCCEEWGYLISEDDTSDFIGAELVGIKLVDESKNVKAITDLYLEEGGIIFINFETSKGTFQVTLYNSHNGYYGHRVEIISNQLNLEDFL